VPDVPDRLDTAFSDLHAAVSSRTRLPGLAAARATAIRRRATRLAAGTAALVAVLLVAVGVGLGVLRNMAPPSTGASTPPASSSPSPSPTGPRPAGPPLADQVPATSVQNATLDVPAFALAGCPSGPRTFDNRYWQNYTLPYIQMLRSATGDLNGDGESDILLVLRCNVFEPTPASSEQVVAYSGGGAAPQLLAQVWAGDGDITRAVVAEGTVELDIAPTDSGTAAPVVQERYRWTGSAFALTDRTQIAHAPAPNLELTVDPPSVAPTADGVVVRVTARNVGTTPLRPLDLSMASSVPLSITVDGLPGTLGRFDGPPQLLDSRGWSLAMLAPDPGASTTLTLHLALAAAGDPLTVRHLVISLRGNANTRTTDATPVTVTLALG
jgi:hypothetical protein